MSQIYYCAHNSIIAHIFSIIAHFDSIIAHFDSIIAQLGSIIAHFFSIIAQISPVSAISILVRYFNRVSVTSQTDNVNKSGPCASKNMRLAISIMWMWISLFARVSVRVSSPFKPFQDSIIAHFFSIIAQTDSIIAHFDSIIAHLGSIIAHFFSIIAHFTFYYRALLSEECHS
jgi:hypothetical protein